MTPAYERDARLQSIATEVVESGDDDGRPFAVTTDTVLYPEGGGQPADHGTIGDRRVLDVQKRQGRIVHYLDRAISPGPVEVRLDWPRRWDHMQQHTGQHLLTAVADARFGWATTAFHLGPEVSDIELAADGLGEPDLRALEQEVATEILAARLVRVSTVTAEDLPSMAVRSRGLPEDLQGAVRLVEIEGLDCNTCGGTHVASTAEIGMLAIIGHERLRGGTRIFFVAGDRLRRRLAAHEQRNAQLRTLLGAPDEELVGVTTLRLDKEKELARQSRRLLDELAAAEAVALAAQAEPVAARHWPERDLGFLQLLGRRLAEQSAAACALLTAGAGDQGVFLLLLPDAMSKDDGDACLAAVLQSLEGRGGGSGRIRQGKAARLDRLDLALEILRDRLPASD